MRLRIELFGLNLFSMSLEARLLATLDLLAGHFAAFEDDYWIISGAAVALHGVKGITVGDVDVLTSIADGERLISTLALSNMAENAHPLFRSSLLAQWRAPPLIVEIMADLHVFYDSHWCQVLPQTREPISVGSHSVFVPSRHELHNMLCTFGRDKDVERARLLL
jgi:hypothetical protein